VVVVVVVVVEKKEKKTEKKNIGKKREKKPFKPNARAANSPRITFQFLRHKRKQRK